MATRTSNRAAKKQKRFKRRSNRKQAKRQAKQTRVETRTGRVATRQASKTDRAAVRAPARQAMAEAFQESIPGVLDLASDAVGGLLGTGMISDEMPSSDTAVSMQERTQSGFMDTTEGKLIAASGAFAILGGLAYTIAGMR